MKKERGKEGKGRRISLRYVTCAIVLSGVDDNSVSQNGIFSIQRDFVVGVIVISGPSNIVIDVAHISNVSGGERRDTVDDSEGIVMGSCCGSVGVGNISKLVEVKSVKLSI